MAQVDRLLALSPGTARRWIDGYRRGGHTYPPVVRIEATGEDIVTWGEFVETRLLSEYRDAGALTKRMRPAIEKLRETFNTRYPLAHGRPFVAGRELVMQVQETVGLESALRLVVIRNGQVVLTEAASNFYESVEFRHDVAVKLRPVRSISEVVMDPLRQFGEPAVRSVRTEIIAEHVRAGERIDAICELYELSRDCVEAAIRYELIAEDSMRPAA
jgi:uncharacterized protein (DUF433 family)